MTRDGALAHALPEVGAANLPIQLHGENAPTLPAAREGKRGRLLRRPPRAHPAATVADFLTAVLTSPGPGLLDHPGVEANLVRTGRVEPAVGVRQELPDHLRAALVALTAGAVLVLTLAKERLPVVALGLTLSFGLYACLKKSLPIGPNQGSSSRSCSLPRSRRHIWLTSPPRDRAISWRTPGSHLAPARLRRGHCRAAPVLRERGEASAPVDDRHHAVHRADHDLPHRGLRLRRGPRRAADDRLPDDLGRPDLHGVPCPAGARCQGRQVRCPSPDRPEPASVCQSAPNFFHADPHFSAADAGKSESIALRGSRGSAAATPSARRAAGSSSPATAGSQQRTPAPEIR